ncbi:unnamed protein product, partial [Iphiclides podalirius]
MSSPEEMAGPSPKREKGKTNVRRSIGEWENDRTDKNPSAQTRVTGRISAAPTKKLAGPSQPGTSVEIEGSSPGKKKEKYADRVAEARACLQKAKLHLSNSRNLKTEIKVELLQSIERMYQFVKEAEADREAEGNKGQEKSDDRPVVEIERKEEAESHKKKGGSWETYSIK